MVNMMRYVQNCRLCGSAHLELILDLGLNHIQGAFITKNNPNPPRRKIPNQLVWCNPRKGGCSLVQSSITPPPEILFSNYFYKSGVNETMRKHLKYVVDKLLEFGPNPERVMDLASNDNTLLLNYSNTTEKWGVEPNNIGHSDKENNITVINSFFPTKQTLPKNNSFITALAVLYDLDNPLEFVKSAIEYLKMGGIFCFEVMYLPSILKYKAFDTFLGEHLTHWSLFTIENLVQRCGGRLIDVELTPTNGGSILVFVTQDYCDVYNTKERQNNILELKKHEFDMAIDGKYTFMNFNDCVKQHMSDLKTTLHNLKEQGKKICLYGNSTKSNVIVESAGLEDYFAYGIERSDEKVGGQTLWGLPIKSEVEAREDVDKNTIWFIGPYFFKESIIKREQEFLNMGGRLLFPLPEIVLYPN